jgi:hypothetical protein
VKKILRKLAAFIAIAGGLCGLTLSLPGMHDVFGSGGFLVGLFLFPYTFVYFPFYALFVDGSWNLLLINYGCLGVSWFLLSITEHREKQPRSAIAEPSTMPVATQNSTFAFLLLLAGGITLTVLLSALSRALQE